MPAGRQLGARLDGDVGDNETLVVQRQVRVDRLREDAVLVVEEEDGAEEEEDDAGELDAGADLW